MMMYLHFILEMLPEDIKAMKFCSRCFHFFFSFIPRNEGELARNVYKTESEKVGGTF
jgi:hypothetical protein